MMITKHTLCAALRRILSRCPAPSDYSKLQGGRIVRYVDWRRATKGGAR